MWSQAIGVSTSYKKGVRNVLSETIMNTVLEDDDSPYGGVDYVGETVREFVESSSENMMTLDELNAALVECGIKEITERK